MSADADSLDGIEVEAVEAYFRANVPGAEPPLRFERVAGGRSNITYVVRDAGDGSWVLRRPPLGERLGSAHDMGREHRIMSGLQGTDVPVPRTIAMCEDEDVTGAPFYVMDYVEGAVLRDEAAAADYGDDALRRRAGESVVDTLVALHAVDPESVGLGELGRHDGYAARQLKRWKRQWDESATRAVPAMDETHALLSERIPAQQGVALVHGDYRLDNVILDAEGAVSAVLDWELCTLGDPLADVGLLLVYWSQADDAVHALGSAPTLASGFMTRDEVRDRYASASGRDLSDVEFFVALGYWKLAAILEGVYKRYSSGAYGGDASDFDQFATVVEQLAAAALDAAKRL